MENVTETVPQKPLTRSPRIERSLLVLSLAHFIVDFFGGLLTPLPEPTLTRHLGVELGTVAVLLGGCALLTDVIQPLSGWFLPRRGLPFLLLLCPLFASFSSFIGLSHSMAWVAFSLILSATAIGLVHPEAILAAHAVAKKRPGFGMALYVSSGYFGFSCGSLVSGLWVDHFEQDLSSFWCLGLLVIPVLALIRGTGLHRMKGHVEKTVSQEKGPLPFYLIFPLTVSIAANMCLLVRFITILLVRSFPDQSSQAWGGATVFASGISGALGSFVWGHLSDRWGKARLIVTAQLLAIPFLYMMTHPQSPSWAPFWGVGTGCTLGAVFPLAVILARSSHGLSDRLRMGLSVGGAWGIGEIGFILAGRYVGRFVSGNPLPVQRVYWVCWFLLFSTTLLALFITKKEPPVPALERRT